MLYRYHPPAAKPVSRTRFALRILIVLSCGIDVLTLASALLLASHHHDVGDVVLGAAIYLPYLLATSVCVEGLSDERLESWAVRISCVTGLLLPFRQLPAFIDRLLELVAMTRSLF